MFPEKFMKFNLKPNVSPVVIVIGIDVKNVFYVFYYFFLFLERFLFSSGENFYPTKPAKILLNLLIFP